jgi:predicted permease
MRRILLKLWRRRQLHQDLEAELMFHRDLAHERGNPIPLGNTTHIREQALDLWRFTLIEDLWRDLLYAIRSHRRSPALAWSAILSLGLGIGANTAIFSLVDKVLLRTLPVERPEELEQITLDSDFTTFSYPFYRELRRGNQAFSSLIARSLRPASMAGQAGVERGVIEIVSGNYFAVLGVRPLQGRVFTDDDNRVPMGHPVTVLSHRYWRDRLSSDAGIIGKTIHIDQYPFTVIGIAPAGFFGMEVGSAPDAWVPIMMQPQVFLAGTSIIDDPWRWLAIIGRRAPGVSEPQAQTAATLRLQQIQAGQVLPRFAPREVRLIPAGKGLSRLRTSFERPLHILMAVVGLLLLITSANIANLLLARAASRRREVAVRLGLGAGRARLVRQLLTESLLLGVIGGALGVGLAASGVRMLLRFLPAARVPYALEVSMDGRMLGFSLAISILTGLFFGLVPALQATRMDSAAALKGQGAILGSALRRWDLRKALVAFQVAISMPLLAGAGLFLRSLQHTDAIRAGLDTDNVVMASIDPALSGYSSSQARGFYHQLEARLKETAGVYAVGTSVMPLLGGESEYNVNSLKVPGAARPPRGSSILWNTVGGDFFHAVGIRILRGRDFGPQDAPNGPMVGVINEAAAHYFFGNEEAIGRGVTLGKDALTIVGIASDSKYRSVRENTPRVIYTLSDQNTYAAIGEERTVYLRTSGDPAPYVSVIRATVRDLGRELPVYNLKTFADQKAESLVRERLLATVSGFFGGLALLLAAIGLYGVIAFAVVRRTREIGIRVSLGARRATVVWMVLRGALGMVLAGICAGLVVSRWLSQWVTAELYGIGSNDPATLAAACTVLTAVAVLAAFFPAWKASRVDPLVALRYE